jgi:hypothetical protein
MWTEKKLKLLQQVDIVESKIKPEYSRPIGYWEPSKMLMPYGDGFPLLFQFMKFIIIMFVSLFIVQGIYTLIVLSLYWADGHTTDESFAEYLSIKLVVEEEDKVDDDLRFVYEWIAFISTMFLIILTCFFWVKQTKYQRFLDEDNKTDADYAVMFTNLPKDMKRAELIDIVTRTGVSEDSIIYTNRCYNIEHIMKMKNQRLTWLQRKKYLELYRNKKKEEGYENYKEKYPPKKLISLRPCLSHPTDEEIKENLKRISDELLNDNNK